MQGYEYYFVFMEIKVICFGYIADNLKSENVIDVPDGTLVGQLSEILNFDSEKVAMYFIGDERIDSDFSLTPGDIVKIFPPITGG